MKKTLTFLLLAFMVSSSFAQSLPGRIPTDSLLAWYPFNGNANNEFGPVYHGRITGATLATDRYGTPNSAYHFNGDTDRITIDTAFFNVGWSDYTVSFWFNSDTSENYYNSNRNQCLFNTLPHNGIDFSFNWGGSEKYGIYQNSSPGVRTWDILTGATSNAATTAHIWHHIVLSKQHDTSYSFFLDGVLDSTYSSSILASSYFCKMILGNTDSSVGFEGSWGVLDDYGFWKRTLAGCEIRRMYDTASNTYITAGPADRTATSASTVRFTIADTGTGNTYQWQKSSGTGYTNIAAAPPYSGVTTGTLTVTGVTTALSGTRYRCVVSGAQPCTDTSAPALLTVATTSIATATTNTITIVPNPTSGDISVLGTGKVDIRVYNTLGQQVMLVRNTDKIAMADLPSGIYTLKLYSDKGELIHNDKIIKK